MADGACNYRFAGPAMRTHWKRFRWNVKHILDFKNLNPHTEPRKKKIGLAAFEAQPKAYQDFWPSLVDIPVRYARLCPIKAGKVQFAIGMMFCISFVANAVLAGILLL